MSTVESQPHRVKNQFLSQLQSVKMDFPRHTPNLNFVHEQLFPSAKKKKNNNLRLIAIYRRWQMKFNVH